ncbi:MAG: threonine/serine exporter family protein [Erysipelotrichaceae bacterium]|nr:threonine/serine exporter family protein [Erysipelotrichaceae bacterium]
MNEVELLDMINEIGYLLLKHGAEIYRVEESLRHMCEAYNFEDIEVFALPTYFTISLKLSDGTPYHYSKVIHSSHIHLDHVHELNQLVREMSNQQITYKEIKNRIDYIKNTKLDLPLILFGYMFSSAMFCMFFGGGIKEMLVAASIGFVLFYVVLAMEALAINSIVRTILASMVIATIAIIAYKIGLIVKFDATIIGCLMILTPGIAITNSLRDMIGGNLVSGTMRLVEAILIAASIAIGVGIVMVIGGI